MQISWTRLPFKARNQEEFQTKLTEWLSWVFYDELPAKGYEVREEQIYTAFRMAKALSQGKTLMAEAGPGTGKTFAYLLPAVCYARLKGAPVVVASASPVLQAQLMDPEGDVRTLSRLLGLEIDARLAADPGEYVCEVKVGRSDYMLLGNQPQGWGEFRRWAQTTGTGARTEVPDVSDEVWEHLAWDPGLACDTCEKRGHCHVMTARRHYREAADLVICDHKLFSRDLLTRHERHLAGQVPYLPAYSAAILDEGHHMPETWQRSQGYVLSRSRLGGTLEHTHDLVEHAEPVRPEAQRAVQRARQWTKLFFDRVEASAAEGEGKRHVRREDEAVVEATRSLHSALEALQDELVTEEAMNEGTSMEISLNAYQARLDEVRAALRLFQKEETVPWVEGNDLWVVPRQPKSMFGEGRLSAATPVIFSSATLEPAYQARVLQIKKFEASTVGVPFDLGEQALVYQPPADADKIARTVEILKASNGKALVLLNSLADVRRWKAALEPMGLPWELLFEGDADRGAQLDRFRHNVTSVLFGATFWEGVDVPGEALSCLVVPALPFPEHDPLILERRRQAEAHGDDPFEAVDLPEMLIKLKQGFGRLIRSAEDRGVLCLLDRSWMEEDWAPDVEGALPEDAERTEELPRITAFLASE